jgi:putative membrane protein
LNFWPHQIVENLDTSKAGAPTMRKDRFGRYLPIMTAVTAMALYPAPSNAQSMGEKAQSALTNTADSAKAMLNGAPAPGSPADVLSQIHETDEAEIKVGSLAEKKGSTEDVRKYGKELAKDHSAADRKVIALAKEEGIELAPPAGASADLQKKENHNGAVAEMLANVTGNTFDRDFLEAMRKDHEKDIANLTAVMNSTADPKLKNLIAELLPKLKHHQEMAEKLLAEAKANAGAATSPSGS